MDCRNRVGSVASERLPPPSTCRLPPSTPSSTTHRVGLGCPVLSSLRDSPVTLGPGEMSSVSQDRRVAVSAWGFPLNSCHQCWWWPTQKPAAWLRPGSSLLWPPPALALSNFSPMLLLRSCVSPAYSLWTAADCILLVTRSRCPPCWGPPLPEYSFPALLLK